ncbi:protein kinase domain-containing protein [Aspergillus candidus]|uniref:Kinase domain-containing protein n=1 Tax=Aspergillus candidus TaxID=41067 RepID=A0A2I2FCR1_ASPCN|nr:kinase domain-containing protein [Aspergillus candidus]PLB38409.1 kinase domain-containing protein [Aspergillus candidus]
MAPPTPLRVSVRTANEHRLDTRSPPVTPRSGFSSVSLSPIDDKRIDQVSLHQDLSAPLEFRDSLEVQHDSHGKPFEYGRGVWSVVYKASSRPPSNSSLLTPPSSPAPGNHKVAVKSPSRRDAHVVLDAEALALSRISLFSGSDNYVVPFHGYIPGDHAIVLDAVPLSLATYIEDKAAIAKQNMSTRTMFDPAPGMASWKALATKLIRGLSWLHNTPHIVHGDIKPHNLLLRPLEDEETDFPFTPLFADFSSAHIIAGPSLSAEKNQPGTALTALTPPFAAPELLTVSSLTSLDVRPTPAADVFSLAVTLLAAATGDLLLYPGTSNMQRLAMAREGHRVIEFARSGAHGSRVPRNGLVEQIIKPALAKDPAERINPTDWLNLVESLA